MNLKKIKHNFSQKGFVVVKKIFNKNDINKVLTDLENVKNKVQKTKDNFCRKIIKRERNI